jgi:hypothetical protein
MVCGHLGVETEHLTAGTDERCGVRQAGELTVEDGAHRFPVEATI